MKFHTSLHSRRSPRIKGYDYTKSGLYFITICTREMAHYFGEISNGEMHLNDIGKLANALWIDIPNHFPNAILHEYVVMPNHIHGIIQLSTRRTRHGVSLSGESQNGTAAFGKSIPGSISTIINQFKSSIKRHCNKNGFDHFHWQPRFYSININNIHAYHQIAQYILNNPAKWETDRFRKT